MRTFFYSNKGAVRPKNEDTILGVSLGNYHIFAVCDGMGGGTDGKFASSTVCKTIISGLQGYQPSSLELLQSYLKGLILTAHKEIYDKYHPIGKQSGTTCTLVGIYEKEFFFIHVGDSRLYKVGENELEQLTVDDTFVQRQVSKGLMSLEQAATHPKRHVITDAVGVFKNVNLKLSPVLPFDKSLVLASDGYADMLSVSIVKNLLSSSITVSEVADVMMTKGQKDNLSIIIIQKED